ncbi:MAG: Glyoxalase family protein [Labilithrix sp.]|nr:Glyoxalase family protein [Labilithrix sp.]
MKAPPPNWPRISSTIFYEDANAAIDWLCKAFGFEVQIKVEGDDGAIEHSELVFGGGLVMVSSPRGAKAHKFPWRRVPSEIGGGNTQALFAYVDDIEAHCERARAAGAAIVAPPSTNDYGEDYWADRSYECVDPGGHHWWFAQRMRGPGA